MILSFSYSNHFFLPFQKPSQEVDTLSDEDEAVASDLDLHALIVAHNPPDLEIEPLQSAEEVIKEIDDLMQAFSHSFVSIEMQQFFFYYF